MLFSKVVYDKSVDTDIARVNRATGVLYLNPAIWDNLTPDEREFVLLHENGHLELQTASEYQANRYAVGKYLNVKNLSNAELGKRIQVVSEITDPTRYISGNFFAEIGNAVAAIGSVSNETFKIFGIGRKSREAEAAAAAKNAMKLENTKAANTQKIAIVGGMLVVVVVIIFFVFKK